MAGRNGVSSTNEQAKGVVLVHTVQLKPMIKAQITGRIICSGISDVAIASVYSEKTCLKKLIIITIIIIIMNKSQETGFWQAPEIDFCYETKARIVMVDVKFDAL